MPLFSSSRRALLVLAAVPTLAIGALFAAIAYESRLDVTRQVLQADTNLANTVEENISRTLDFYNRSLVGLVAELNDPATMRLPASVRQRILFDKAIAVPGMATMVVIGPDGAVRFTSDSALAPANVQAGDRDYFIRHRQHADLGLEISQPIMSRLDGRTVVVLSRRITGPDGSFGGVAVVALEAQYFNGLFNAVNLGDQGRISLLRDDGILLARYPMDQVLIGRSLRETAVFQRYQRGEQRFLERSGIDGVPLIYLLKPVEGYPLLISVGQSADMVYAEWRSRTVTLGLVTLGLMGTCLGLAWLLLRELDGRQRVAQQLRTAERDLRTILDSLPSMVAYWDRSLRIRFANSRYMETFAGGVDESTVTPDGLRRGQRLFGANALYFERALGGERQLFETPVSDSAGQRRYMLVSFVPDMEGDEVAGVFVQATDITDRKAAEDRLLEEKERIRVTLASIGDAVISTDAEGRVTYLNPAAEQISGWPPAEAVGRPVVEVLPLHDGDDPDRIRDPVAEALREQRIVAQGSTSRLVNRQQERYDIEDTAAPIQDRHGATVGAVMVLRDVTQARAMALRMAHLAQYDVLTGLPNRVLLLDRAHQAIARGRREGTGFALMYLDLDGFKHINDSLGHDAGDAVLVQFAHRLSAALRQSDTLSRQGGDEFIVLAPMVPDVESAQALAAKLVALASHPFEVDGRSLRVTTSLGVALFPEDGDTYDLLARHADAAMYSAKRAGKNQLRFYTGDIGRQADSRFARDHLPP